MSVCSAETSLFSPPFITPIPPHPTQPPLTISPLLYVRLPACKQTATRLLSSPRSFMSIKCLFFSCRKRASALPALLFFPVEPTPTAHRGGAVFFADRTRCNLIVQGRTTLLTFREKSGQKTLRRSRTHSQRSKQEDFDYSWRERFNLCFSPLRS